jgi:hypothetical protein
MLTVHVIGKSKSTRLSSSFLLIIDITFFAFHIAMADSMFSDLIDGFIVHF